MGQSQCKQRSQETLSPTLQGESVLLLPKKWRERGCWSAIPGQGTVSTLRRIVNGTKKCIELPHSIRASSCPQYSSVRDASIVESSNEPDGLSIICQVRKIFLYTSSP